MTTAWSLDRPAWKAHLLLIAINLLPLFIPVSTNLNILLTAAVTVYAGSWRSVKPIPSADALTKSDAMRFPLVGSAVLFGLFLMFKFLPKALVNTLLSAYMGIIAIFVCTAALTPYIQGFFPHHAPIALPRIKIPILFDNTGDHHMTTNVVEIFCGLCSCVLVTWYLMKKHWVANNTLALAFALEGIEHLNLGSVQVGAILLVGLFFYDIFWVFCTPVMVTVAKNFDGPIKLLFPKAMLAVAGKREFSMLGLGDIVIPGIFVAMLLRYDVFNNFKTSYFRSSFIGYTAGLGTTIFVMNYFKAAQPALLYIVPAVLGAVGIHALVKGELKQIIDYTEETAHADKTDGASSMSSASDATDKKKQ